MPDEPTHRDSQIEEVEWHWLRLHLERGALIIIQPQLALREAARTVAADEVAEVRGWIEAGQITKPTLEQIAAWNAEPGKRFRMVIVQPYVLVQEI